MIPIEENLETQTITRDPYGPGFYKLYDELVYAPNFVKHKDFELYKEQKDTYSFPVDGWYWFNDESEANAYFNL